jgi:hypothetical protein
MNFTQQQSDVIAAMQHTLAALQANDPRTLSLLAEDNTSALAKLKPEARRKQAIRSLNDSITVARAETVPEGHPYHSRDPLTGLIQSQLEDNVIPELQATGQGNPVVWIPAGILGILEHFNPKYPFQTATPAASRIAIPDTCKIALLGDWGADNIHAERIAKLALAKGADYIIHLGDIYYSGTAGECLTFLQNWPLKNPDGTPVKGKSFALNGNHEMYSLGRPYFTIVLPAFGQEASYFTLYNKHWQFQGLDTAYVPFSIDGHNVDDRLKVQYDWLLDSIVSNPTKANILLSHNQPVSAHIPEFEAAQPLMDEARSLLQKTIGTAIYAWFFGHEHRCTIYDDTAQDPNAYFRARLIGNGAIPHHPQEEVTAEAVGTRTTNSLLKVNSGSVGAAGDVALCTFALLTLKDAHIHVDYVNEDDTLFYSEDWDAAKKLW